jgi:uroporphyrinogen decarboxylase
MYDGKPNFDRVIKTLKHMEPDRVPMLEAAVDYEIMSQFLGRTVSDSDIESQVEFWTKAGYDHIPLTVGMMQPGKVTENSAISKFLRDVVLRDTVDQQKNQAWNLERRSQGASSAIIANESDVRSFPWEQAARDLDFSKFYTVQKYLPENMKIVAMSGKIFTLTWMLMGFENFGINLAVNPGIVEQVFKRVAEIQYTALSEIVKIPNVAAVWAIDDLAFKTGPMISPKMFRQYVFPWYKQFGEICRENNLYFFFHSDGVVWQLIEDFIDAGVDALHPIDPTCMDILEVKKKYGDRLTLIGNVSNEMLMNGTPTDIANRTRELISTLAPGGGYCLSSGNSVPDWANFENYKAMIETVKRYGSYPIRVEQEAL